MESLDNLEEIELDDHDGPEDEDKYLCRSPKIPEYHG
jgi:hypothetical protein